jgi:hypothetical protein
METLGAVPRVVESFARDCGHGGGASLTQISQYVTSNYPPLVLQL